MSLADERPIGSYALSTSHVLAVNGCDQSVDSSRFCEALRVAVLVGIGAKILKERLPPGFGVSTVRDAGARRVDISPALVADHTPADSHRDILAQLTSADRQL